ncbi:MAG: LLM class flavin-dependent oxidoreductase [Chloroflexi bacterium]|nr:LLM class flavin-dependent oxidoreductase [Chloroflexota bacterium]MDA1270666.1 LLM class flavin-dependent oxidoreductase [Chloroflexota bacterium]
MEFGLFVEFPSYEGTTQAQIFKDSMQLIDAAEESGSEGVWLAEYHFDAGRSVLSAPVTVAGAVAARTKRVKIGLAVHVLPLRNPVQVAEEIATLDHLSEGRLDFGIGRSAIPSIYQGYGFNYAESWDRFDECLEIILKCWTAERFSFSGKFYQYDDLCVVPKPLQKPHPPIRVGATSADTFELVGRMGYPIFINPSRVTSLLDLKPMIAEFHQARKKAGHTGKVDVGLRVPVYVAKTEAKAHSEPKESTMFQMQRLVDVVTKSIGQKGISAGDDRSAQAKRLAAMTYEDVMDNTVVYGTPDSVVARLQELQEELGLTQIIYEVNFGCSVPLEHQIKSVQLLNEKVVPRFK